MFESDLSIEMVSARFCLTKDKAFEPVLELIYTFPHQKIENSSVFVYTGIIGLKFAKKLGAIRVVGIKEGRRTFHKEVPFDGTTEELRGVMRRAYLSIANSGL